MHLADSTNLVTTKKIFCIVGIAILHIVASSFDQFFLNVVRGEGYAHQIVRDVGFMVPDIMQLVIPLWLLNRSRNESYSTRPFYRDRSLHKDIVAMIFFVIALFAICTILWEQLYEWYTTYYHLKDPKDKDVLALLQHDDNNNDPDVDADDDHIIWSDLSRIDNTQRIS